MSLLNTVQNSIQHINSVTHEGKVVIVGTAIDGKIYYTVKQDGYEDTHNSTRWENWKTLEFPNEDPDSSVVEKEKKELTCQDPPNGFILQSRYKTNEESAVAPVQLVSALGHIYVFRQSKSNTLLVDRFVLDGMTNTLNRKLEVRYQQSRKKYEPNKPNKNSQGIGLSSFDSLNFQDKNGKKFYEPTTEISIINKLSNGWFSVILLPTNELDKYRWQIFAYNSETKKVELISIQASEEGLFDVKDSTVFDPKPGELGVLVPRKVPGIIRRSFDLKDDKGNSLQIINGFAATKYDVQSETLTQDGETQLIKDATKVMLVIPTNQGNTAALSFAAAKDGTLSQISENPQSPILRGFKRDVLLPLNTLDEIKAIGDSTPPAIGTIAGMKRTEEADLVQIISKETVTLKSGDNVKIQGTKHYNGYHVVQKIDANTFEIAAKWVEGGSKNWQVGTWEEVPTEESGLIFDGIITAYERTEDGKLRITSPNHGLENGNGVQISDTQGYDGTYSVTKADGKGFTLDVKWQPGMAANATLESRKQRGINFDGNGDYIETPALLGLKTPSPDYSFGQTYSAWIYISSNTTREQLIVGEQGQLMQLLIMNNKAILRFGSSTSTKDIADPTPLPINEWVHYAVSFDYDKDSKETNKTKLVICRNGQQVSSASVPIPETLFQDTKNTWNPKFFIGGIAQSKYFTGKIANVQVWNHARQPNEILDSMYLRLTGKEVGLVGYWRLGAIVEGDKREVVDFSVFANNGIVYGDAFVSAVTLDRKLKDNQTLVVKYTNDEMVAITQRATYEESFEFKLDKSIDPNNIDGKENKVFSFSYWGKANRDSEKREIFSGVPANFQLVNGWYQASARFTIPDGVKLVRSFGLVDVKGDWTKLEIRKHRIQLVSDAITEARYNDEIKLSTVTDQQSENREKLQQLTRYEQEEATLLLRKWELEQLAKPETKTNLDTKKQTLTREQDDCKKKHDDAVNNRENYWCKVISEYSGKVLDVSGASMGDANVHQWTWVNGDNQKWQFVPVGDGYYKIVVKHSQRVLDVEGAKQDNFIGILVCGSNNQDNQKWKLEDLEGNTFKIVAKHSGKVLDVSGMSKDNGAKIQQFNWDSGDQRGRKWIIEKLSEYPNDNIKNANDALQSKRRELAEVERQLNDFNNTASRLSIVNARLTNVQAEIAKLKIGNQVIPVGMKLLTTDSRKLITQGALLDFVRPTSRLTAIETCEGNVQLSYFDNQGKMQQTNFDATADSRNA
ncbi:RICIN domain-containing protein [Desmonostoc muscorum LEGE 12446]|uniref:RICIN domain-containing protein n=1 Tax=Desmonostoc muscorum LEGE 12446 TaxID=1828758 RepID=A0A8J6ZH75_DESMC|nr:RICIN domain-containing protein [Desmonostoc muscorum]MCF2149779.1 RICIN domain-containing protein [Desmonostoc muscorum LEGE 12446]